jgi:hypothetical protein
MINSPDWEQRSFLFSQKDRSKKRDQRILRRKNILLRKNISEFAID